MTTRVASTALIIATIFMATGCAKAPRDAEKKAPHPKVSMATPGVTAAKAPDKTSGVAAKSTSSKVPTKSVAKKELAFIELSGNVVERNAPNPFGTKHLPLTKLLKAIKKLGALPGADTLFIYISDFNASMETMWELNLLLNEIKIKDKKKIVVYGDAFSAGTYLLASAATKIYLNPAGEWGVTGFAMQSMFLKDFLAWLGVSADFLQMGKFKGAAENLTRSSMSAPLKESLSRLLDTMFAAMLKVMGDGRSLKPEMVKALIDSAPLTAEDALKAKLIDGVESYHAVFNRLKKGKSVRQPKKKKREKMSLISLLSPPKAKSDIEVPHVALVIADGPINYGTENPNDFFSDESKIHSKTLIKWINKVAENDHAKALLLRVNSPGGSALASEKIWQALKACSMKKPIVVSMGAYAASGGYYIAAVANEIVTSPFTITGSIGVVGGKIVVGEALKKLKIHTELLQRGANSAWMSGTSRFSPSERAAILRTMQTIYSLFKKRVADGRRGVTDVEALAQGRVWSGTDAITHKLADSEGGLLYAASRARALGKLKASDPVMLYPRPKPFMAALTELFDKGTPLDEVTLSVVSRYLPQLKGLAQIHRLLKQERVLVTMPVILTEVR